MFPLARMEKTRYNKLINQSSRPTDRCEYVQACKFRLQFLLTAHIQRHLETNPMPTPTCGAYQSTRKVTACDCSGAQIWFLPESHRSMHQTRPSTLFSPIFSLAREKIGPPEARQKRPRRNESLQARLLILCARFFLSKPQTEFAVWVFLCKSVTTSQSAYG